MIKLAINKFFNQPYLSYGISLGFLGLAALLIYVGVHNGKTIIPGAVWGVIGGTVLISKIILDVKKYEIMKKQKKLKTEDVEDIPAGGQKMLDEMIDLLKCRRATMTVQDALDTCENYPIFLVAIRNGKKRALKSFITENNKNITLQEVANLGWEPNALMQ